MSESILQEAEELINGDRAAAYGSPLEQYTHLAALLNAYLGIDTITWQDAINIMLLIKVNRVRPGKPFHRDSYADTAGYAGCAEKAHNESQRPARRDLNFSIEVNDPRVFARQWETLADVPKDVDVKDDEGDFWKFDSLLGWRWRRPDCLWHEVTRIEEFDAHGPFTEVLARHDQKETP